MSIVSHVRLAVLRPKEAPAWVKEQWAEVLKANAERINQKRQKVIGNWKDFQSRIARAAGKKWPSLLNPAFRSRAGNIPEELIASFNANLMEAFGKYDDKLNRMFETVDGIPAKRFKEAVDAMAQHFSEGTAKRTLPFTGDRVTGRGPAALAGLWLTKDSTVEEILRAGDQVLQGGPISIVLGGMEPAFKAGLTNRIVQAGANILKAELQASTMARQNDLTNHLVQSMIDPGLGLTPFATGGLSHVDFVVDHGALFLDIQVDQI